MSVHAKVVPLPKWLGEREGPCNDPACRTCDPMRARLFAHGVQEVRKVARRERAGLRRRR